MDKYKNLAAYLIAIVIIIVGAYFSGILKGFTPKDFKNAYKNFSTSINKQVDGPNRYAQKSSGNGNVKTYGKYHPNLIDKAVVEGSEVTGAWSNVFKSSKKTVFYIYDSKDNFYSEVSNYFYKSGLERFYNYLPYSKTSFSNYNVGNASYSKICNSMEECKAQRDRAAKYTKLANFMEACGKTICVINGSKKQYVRLPKRDAAEAKQLLEGLKLW